MKFVDDDDDDDDDELSRKKRRMAAFRKLCGIARFSRWTKLESVSTMGYTQSAAVSSTGQTGNGRNFFCPYLVVPEVHLSVMRGRGMLLFSTSSRRLHRFAAMQSLPQSPFSDLRDVVIISKLCCKVLQRSIMIHAHIFNNKKLFREPDRIFQ